MMILQKYQALSSQQRSRQASRRAVWGLLALMLITAALSYGFVWRAEVLQEEEYRRMIYDISKSMGENEPCFEQAQGI